MLRLSRLIALSLLLSGAVAVAACSPRVASTGGPTPEPQQPSGGVDPSGPVAVAVLAPSTAENQGTATLGKALVNAARMAAVDLADPQLELKVYDTAGEADRAAAMARQAVADGARMIVGPLFGANTRAVGATAAQNGINVVSFSTDSSVAGGPVFLSGFLPEMAARRITSYAGARGYGALGIFHPQTPYGQAALRGAREGVGGALVAATEYRRTEEGIPPAAADFAARVRDTGARGLLIAESGQALRFVAAELEANGLAGEDHRFLGLGQWDTRATLDTPALVGGWFAAPDPTRMKAFVEKYETSFDEVPPQLAVLGYDAVQIAGQLLADARRSGARDPFDRRALTRPQGFRGAVGPIRFRRDGLGERGMAILEVGLGTFSVVDPVPAAFGLGS